MKNILKLFLLIIIFILTIVTILIGYLFIKAMNMPYDDSGTYMDETGIIYHDQSIIGYGAVFCLLLVLIGALIFCFKTIFHQPTLKEWNKYDGLPLI